MSPSPSSALLMVVSAPSGAGKTTLCNELLAHDERLTRAITCTTRAPRPGERDGIDYYFITPEIFRQRVAEGAFLEHATVHGHAYGTLRAEVKVRYAPWLGPSGSRGSRFAGRPSTVTYR